MDQKEIDSLIRHQTYIERFGSGLANRTLELFDNEKLKNLILSKKDRKKIIKDLLKKDRKKADKFVLSELRQMAKLENSFVEQLANDFKDLGLSNAEINELIQEALEYPLIVTNNTPQDLINATFERKEQISTSLNSMNVLGIKEQNEMYNEIRSMFSQFARGTTLSNQTLAFTISALQRRKVYEKSKVIDRVLISAILDGRTTPYCMTIDGTIFKGNNGARPLYHPGCRTIEIPLIEGQTNKEAREMLKYRASISPGKNYQKGDATKLRSTRIQTKEGMSKVKSNLTKDKENSNYANFLSSQTKTPEGIQFIQDRLGIKKGNYFIQEIEKGVDPKKLLKSTLFDMKAKDITLDQLKKKIKK